ncbi:MAG: aminotransferase class I/II-fold pyridoxal phosphate-dependent enzyme [Nevskiaceae bacterium]|nr:MAG: aminotransferase class I/II-fold pyridoxal phosphate-dependent enzyme [Nevskiaceae bacterium]TAM26228.1 MAG: aminotransferase class I/II-fold pyridoxal phosphate-dependent enzyme [Nevskiaceae bacterium]
MTALSRRHFLQLAAASGAALVLPALTEADLAQAAAPAAGKGAVLLNYNENPLGPGIAARKAIIEAIPRSGRYLFELTGELVAEFAQQNGLKPDYVLPYAGSSEPLQYLSLAYTGPGRSLITADPTFESAAEVARANGAAVHAVPVLADGAHDVEAMLAADPRAGLIVICNPNNPTGSVTPRAAIEYALAHKPAGALLLVDEAYIHYSEQKSVLDLVAADGELVVLRTFSKLYGMAGLRVGLAVGRPDLLAKLKPYGNNPMPVLSVAAALASLRDASLVPSRKQQTARLRADVAGWLEARGHRVTPSEANCFLFEAGRPGKELAAAMAAQGVVIGRSWPSWPQWSRLTIGTAAEMARFKSVFAAVAGSATATQLGQIEPSQPAFVPHWA